MWPGRESRHYEISVGAVRARSGKSFSTMRAARNNFASAKAGACRCRPIGSERAPSVAKPIGSEIAGKPAIFVFTV